jgi:hypothetical protein
MLLKILAAIGLLLIVLACTVAYQAVTVSLDAERTHQAYSLVLAALTESLAGNSDDWPRSWDELMRRGSSKDTRLPEWPEGVADLNKRVHVDFQLTRDAVAAMHVENFSAVTPRSPNYGPNEPAIKELIRIATRGVK